MDARPQRFAPIYRSASKAAVLAMLALASLAAPAADTLNLDQYRGKVVVLDFWASWCEPCRHSFPWLNAMQAKYGQRGLVIIGVNVDRERPAADQFLRGYPARFDIVYDPTGDIAAHYDVPGMPSSYVFGPAGEFVARHIGFRTTAVAEREAEIQGLLDTVGPQVAGH